MRPLQWQRAVRDSTLPGTTKLVALTLSTWMDSHGRGARPSRETQAKGVDCSPRTIDRHLGLLKATSWLRVAQEGGGRHRPTTYDAQEGRNPTDEERRLVAGRNIATGGEVSRREEAQSKKKPRHGRQETSPLAALNPATGGEGTNNSNEGGTTDVSFANAQDTSERGTAKGAAPAPPFGESFEEAFARATGKAIRDSQDTEGEQGTQQ